MYRLSINFLNLAEKFAFGVWGVTILDLIPFIDLSFLKDVDTHLKTFIAIIGAIYFLIQIVFKTINLNHTRKYNNNIRKIQEESVRMKEMEREYLEFRKDYHTTKYDL